MRNCFFLILFFFTIIRDYAQELKAQSIKGLPTEEVFSLLADSKGFLWVGHSLGLSRYDGVNFTHFHTTLETGSGITDLLEDKHGRIWCHNFSGQIFYIENEKMNLLSDYKFAEETSFPRLAITGNELVATSEKGLFICNTDILQCKYLYSNTSNVKTRSMAILGNVIYEFDGEKWISYKPNEGIHELHFINRTNKSFKDINPDLQPISTIDTIYSKYIDGSIYKFIINKDTVILAATSYEKSYINSIINCDNHIWIHTKKESHTNNYDQKIAHSNLTDIVIDKEGNKWYSSLEKGLLLQPKYTFWKETAIDGLQKNDFVRCFQERNHTYIYGTQNGNIIIKNGLSGKTSGRFKLPSTVGAVENIFTYSDSELLVAPSLGLYLINIIRKKINEISKESTVKSIASSNDTLLIAYSRSLALSDILIQNKTGIRTNKNSFIYNFKSAIHNEQYLRNKRCFAVSIDPNSKKTFAAFSDGLFEIVKNEFKPVLFNKEIITAFSLLNTHNKLFAATFNDGIFMIENDNIISITTKEGLISNNVLKLKLFKDELYVVEPNDIQVLDVNTGKIIRSITLPVTRTGLIYDLWKEDSLLYIASNKSIYSITQRDLNNIIIPVNYLLSATANNSDISHKENVLLPYSQNSLQFRIASPSFIFPEVAYFKYHITGGNDSSWKQTTTNATISFVSLKPGKYKFEAYIVNFQNHAAKPIIFPFTIDKPWWQQWWFYILIIVGITGLTYYFIKIGIRSAKKKDLKIIEELNLKNELRKSLLSTIKAQMNPHFIFNSLNTIQSFVYLDDKRNASKFMGKFSELVRKVLDNSNKQTITLTEEIEILQLYLDLEKVRFENVLNIEFEISNTLDTDNINIPPMLVQPYVENAIVHGLFHKKGNRNLNISIQQSLQQGYFEIRIEDNGIGRNLSNQLHEQQKLHISFANSANEKRIELINQTLSKQIKLAITDKIDDNHQPLGTLVVLSIPSSYN